MSTIQTLEVPGYQVMQFLGSGARSTIWQIRSSETHEVFALKRVVKRSAHDSRFLEQAENEFQIASQLNHPCIRRVVSMRKVKRWLSVKEIHLVMELCVGLTVHDSPPQTPLEIVNIFTAVANGLAFMNSRGFVHSDMKPNNIVVSPEGAVKIIDLGQSCPIGTVKQRIQGTPDFIAPEQVHRRPLDSRTDVYNFGASLYWTLTGQAIPTVLPKKHQANAITDINDLAVTPPEKINPQVSPSLSKLVMDCIQIRPSQRPESMSDVATRLEAIAVTLRNPQSEADELDGPDIDDPVLDDPNLD